MKGICREVSGIAISFVFFVSSATVALADDPARTMEERMAGIESRLEAVEKVDELGHKLHPMHSIYGLKITGGLTLIAQGATAGDYGTSGAFAVSADLSIESPVGGNGRVVGVLDFQKGSGIAGLPGFFASPNGNTTGANNDLESFDDDTVHIAQFYYERAIGERLSISIGQLDPTAYFDANEYANTERAQFLANQFVNNPAIEFGGSGNFYGPGIRATYSASDRVDLTVGAFEGNGDYVDAFDSPFVMAELDVKTTLIERDGNLRVYYWMRQGRPDISTTANPGNTDLYKEMNSGLGLSLDHTLTERLGAWMRVGVQDETVSQFSSHISGGLNLRGGVMNRPGHVAGIAYGANSIGGDYEAWIKSSDPGFEPAIEHYVEAYCNIGIDTEEDDTGFHISPDIQYIVNPGGDDDAEAVFVYGLRLQSFF
jgi:carbohydrate-selective porin OprB